MSNKGPVRIRPIYRQLAEAHGLTEEAVREIVESQFKSVAETIREGLFQAIRLPFFGLFHVLPGRLKHLRRGNKTDQDDQDAPQEVP